MLVSNVGEQPVYLAYMRLYRKFESYGTEEGGDAPYAERLLGTLPPGVSIYKIPTPWRSGSGEWAGVTGDVERNETVEFIEFRDGQLQWWNRKGNGDLAPVDARRSDSVRGPLPAYFRYTGMDDLM